MAPAPAWSQSLQSPEVHTDRTVTFRFRAPNAKQVVVALEGAKSLPMQNDGAGVWSATSAPLDPDYYGYSIVEDGVSLIDPDNPLMKPNMLYTQSMVHVPGPAALPWEVNQVPHGQVDHLFYHSAVVGDDRDFYVYTPPGYNARSNRTYPTLYLLHGYSDDASAWTAVGRVNTILDNLTAQGKVQPMVVVMPLGYGAPEILSRRGPRGSARDVGKRNLEKFTEALLTEVMPTVERTYRVSRDRSDRAIAGLSMGGAESLLTGLNHPETFGWVGSFSGALSMAGSDYSGLFPRLSGGSDDPFRLIWIACGVDDGLLKSNHDFEQWLKAAGIAFTPVETPGAHSWLVWRRNIAAFAPLLFRSGAARAGSRRSLTALSAPSTER